MSLKSSKTEHSKKSHISVGKKIFDCSNLFVMCVIILITLLPLVNALAISFSSDLASMGPGIKLWPSEWSLVGYERLFKQVKIATPLMNSIFTTLVGTVLHVFFCSLTGYVLALKYFPGKNFFTVMLLITYAIPIQNVMIPTFILYRDLGLMNTFVPVIISSMVTAYAVLLLRSFFQRIPVSLREAAIIDGASEFTIMRKIYFPLALPGIATIALYQLVGKWNILLEPVLFINDPSKYTLQVALKSLVVASNGASSAFYIPPNTIMAGVVLAIAPLLIMYPILQRYFIGNLLSGATKG